MIAFGHYASLSRVVSDVETVLAAVAFVDPSSDARGYTLLDRVDAWTHLGLIVSAPQSVETDNLRRDAWVEDDITVELRVQLARTPGQRAGRNAAYDHEERIRETIGRSGDLARYRPSWRRTVRQPNDARDWLAVTQTFRFRRFERDRQLLTASAT